MIIIRDPARCASAIRAESRLSFQIARAGRAGPRRSWSGARSGRLLAGETGSGGVGARGGLLL